MAFDLPDVWTTAGLGLALLALVPGMTSVPSASHIEFKVSRLCALAAAALFLVKAALWGAEDLSLMRLVLVAIVGALIAVSASYALHWINKKEEATSKSEVSTVPQESPKILNGAGGKPISPDIIEGSIFIETKTVARPPIYPPEGHLNVLYLYPHTFAAGSPSQLGVSSVFGMPGAPMPWPKSDSISWDFCTLLEITNDTAFPLRELTIPVHVAYGMEPNIHHLDMTLATVRIDPGSNNRRMIYVVNLAPEGGTMVMGTVATSMKLDDNSLKRVRISLPANFVLGSVLFSPFEPAPEPPAKIKKKPAGQK